MSTRCEIYFTFDLKPDTPPDVLEALRCMIDRNYETTASLATDYVENDWKGALDSTGIEMTSFPGDSLSSFRSAYRYNQPLNQGGKEVYRDTLTFRCEMRSEELWETKFQVLTWLASYSETQGFIGYLRSEYDTSYPDLLFFRDGKLDMRDTFPQNTDK